MTNRNIRTTAGSQLMTYQHLFEIRINKVDLLKQGPMVSLWENGVNDASGGSLQQLWGSGEGRPPELHAKSAGKNERMSKIIQTTYLNDCVFIIFRLHNRLRLHNASGFGSLVRLHGGLRRLRGVAGNQRRLPLPAPSDFRCKTHVNCLTFAFVPEPGCCRS